MRQAAAAGEAAGSRSDLAEGARRALFWWAGELRALVPRALLARSSGRAAALDCVLLPDGRLAFAAARPGELPAMGEAVEGGEAAAARLSALAREARRATVRLSVPRALCFTRRSALPARALIHAGAVLRHEIEALLPLDPAEILSDWYVETEDPEAGELHVVQVVLARPRIRAAESVFAAAGLALTHLTVGDAEGRPVPVDLVGWRDPSLRAAVAALPRGAKLLLLGGLALAAAAPFLAAARLENAAATMAEARAAAPKPSPAALSAAAVADFLDAQAVRVPVSALIDEVARRLPRNASLAEFRLDGERLTLRIAGVPPEAALAALAPSPLLGRLERAPDGADALVARIAPAPGERRDAAGGGT